MHYAIIGVVKVIFYDLQTGSMCSVGHGLAGLIN